MVETEDRSKSGENHGQSRLARFVPGYGLAATFLLVIATSSGCADSTSGVAATAKNANASSSKDGEHSTKRTVDHSVQLAAHRVATNESSGALSSATVPSWAADAIFYQIFPERFANGDKSNDPTRESLEYPDNVSANWKISPWTGDWYARADWERERGPNFYENGVFDRRYGGDLQGVIDKLDYLSNLGINTIYFNPVFYARSLHKYDGSSFHHIDPYFGPEPAGDLKIIAAETSDPATWQWTAADKLFLELLRQAHARNIRVIIDGVFNHTGRTFFAFADLQKRQADSPYRDWYIVQSFDDPATPQSEFRYKGWWGVDSLPEFANNNAGDNLHDGPKKYIFDSTRRWMDPNGDGNSADGIDGWRLDVANEVPTGFWREWHALARKINPQCYTVAETWDDARRFLEDSQFSATMNYHSFSFPVKGFLIDESLAPSGAARQLEDRRNEFPRPMQYALQNLMDSHDTDRLASMIVNAGRRPYSQPARFDYDINVSPRYVPTYDVRKPNDRERRVQRLVALLQMTYVGPPMIYYGTEAGMWGADDPCDRMPMVWPDMKFDAQRADPLDRPRAEDSVQFDEGIFNFYSAAIALRRESPSLRRGTIEFTTADDQAKFLAFNRTDGKETLLVGLNRGDIPYQWRVPTGTGETVVQIFTASGEANRVTITPGAGETSVTVPAIDGVVLRVQTSK
jgi:cyclomaltodextrinase / maltogenic alpha-amylase / neopullulanase